MANYIIIGGDNKEYGPVTEAEIRQWISEGRLNGESRAKAESDAEFRALSLFPEFADALKLQGAPGGATPSITPAAQSGPAWEAEVLSRDPELRLGECLAAGFGFLGANAGFLVAAVFLTWVANLVFVVLSVTVPLLGPLVMLCFNGVIMGGFYMACLRRLRGEVLSPIEVFCGFRLALGQLLLTGLVSMLLTEIAVCCLVLPAIYLGVAWTFAVLVVVDKGLFFWSGMELSRKVVTRVWFEVFILLVIAFLPMVIYQIYNIIVTGRFFFDLYNQAGQNWQQWGQLMQSHAGEMKQLGLKSTFIGQGALLLNLFYCAGVIIRAYENLFGPRKP